MNLFQIHTGLANACFLFSLILAGFSFWHYARKEGIGANLWSVLAAAQVLYMAQIVVGFVLLFSGPARAEGWRWVHVLYGVVLVIVIPGAYAYLRGKDDRQAALVYGLIGLFLAGVSLRAMGTAG